MSASQVALAGSKRPAKIGARRLYDADPSSQMEVTVSLRGPALPGADNMPAKAMSREEYEAKYSASAADVCCRAIASSMRARFRRKRGVVCRIAWCWCMAAWRRM